MIIRTLKETIIDILVFYVQTDILKYFQWFYFSCTHPIIEKNINIYSRAPLNYKAPYRCWLQQNIFADVSTFLQHQETETTQFDFLPFIDFLTQQDYIAEDRVFM